METSVTGPHKSTGGYNVGAGDNATASVSFNAGALSASNDLLVYGSDFYADTGVAMPENREWLMPDQDVPYIIVRDNVCLCTDIDDAFGTALTVSMRLSCAVVPLDQSTLNQLLRTQTV